MKLLKPLFLAFILSLAFLMIFPSESFADVKVRGYYRKDGTYVQPHYRSDPDSSINNNWSTKGNVNPHTGKPGWIDPEPSGYNYSTPKNNTYQSPTYKPSTQKYTPDNNSEYNLNSGTVSGQNVIPNNNLNKFTAPPTPAVQTQALTEPQTTSNDSEDNVAIWSVLAIAATAGFFSIKKILSGK